MDDQMRRMLEGFNINNDIIKAAQSSVSTAPYQAQNYLASLDWDKGMGVRNAVLERVRFSGSLADTYQSDLLAKMDGMLASLQAAAPSSYQLASLLGNLDSHHRRLENLMAFPKVDAATYAPFQDAFSRLTDIKDSVANLSSALNFRLDEMLPLLSAQSQWPRLAQLTLSQEQLRQFSGVANALVGQISDLHSFWGPWPNDLNEEEDSEALEQAVALANERLAESFLEKNPALVIRKMQGLLTLVKSGAIRLAPKVGSALLIIFLNIVSAFFYDAAKVYIAPMRGESPVVEKRVLHTVKQIRKEGVPFPIDMRVVIAKELIVRSGPGQSTSSVGRLYAADRVWLIRTKSDWSLVEFDGEEGDVVLRGWVFSRYIKSLRGGGRSLH